ncbi:MAG: beta-lactamase family protein [Clostridia bacterium]|nr:beta-lactamase family protein [Clostridia bacterium]
MSTVLCENTEAAKNLVNYEEVKNEISKLVHKEMKKAKTTGLSIALVDGNSTVWTQAFGYSDKEKEVSSSPKTIYQIGSITKMLTGIAIMQLAEQGVIDIDKPYQEYVQEFSMKTHYKNAKPFTIRQLMTHYSGVPSDWYDGTRPLWGGTPVSKEEIMNRLKDEYMAFPPDYIKSYSNLGFMLLEYLIEKVSGENFSEYIQKNILNPLGMVHSFFDSRSELEHLVSKGYSDHKEIHYYKPPAAALGMFSNVLDLAELIKAFLAYGENTGRGVVKSETLKDMLTVQDQHVKLQSKCNTKSGLCCWILEDDFMKKLVWHDGGTTFFYSRLMLLPESNLGVIVLANSYNSRKVVDRVGQETLKLAYMAKTGKNKIQNKNRKTMALSKSGPEFDRYVGYYNTIFGMAHVQRVKDQLCLKIGSNPTLNLLKFEGNLLKPKLRVMGNISINHPQLAGLYFYFDTVEGQDLLLSDSADITDILGSRVTPQPIPQAWLKRLGEYEIVNSRSGEFTMLISPHLKKVGDFLVFGVTNEYRVKQSFALTPASENEIIISGIGRMMNETIRAIKVDGEERLIYKGCILKRINNNK